MPLPKQLRLITNGKTINTPEPLRFHSEPQNQAVKTNSVHELTWSKSAAQQVVYFSQRATNTTLSSYKWTHGLATTCRLLYSLPIVSHPLLLQGQTWQALSNWLTACQNKNKSKKPRFSWLFSSLQHASITTTPASKAKPATLTVHGCKSLPCPTPFFLVGCAQSSSARPTAKQSKASIIHHPLFSEPTRTLSGASASAGPHY